MFDLRTIGTITLDIADTYDDGDVQDHAAEMILRLLSQNYQIYLFSSNPRRPVTEEDFEHPGVQFLREPMPPAPVLAENLTDLVAPTNLWITDDPEIGRWLIAADLPLATRKPTPAGSRVLRYGALGDLAAGLDRTARVMREVVRLLAEAKAPGERGARLIGIGGPPLSGQPRFALELKRHLESSGYPLVELLDLSTLMRGTGQPAREIPDGVTWETREAGDWMLSLLTGARSGSSAYVESLPPGVPESFAPHLPLYLSSESVVLAFAEMPFAPPLMELFHLTVLLETSPHETTRRIYELDEQNFDSKFTEQYLAHEGRAYLRYLERYAVRQRVTLRVDANTPTAFFLLPAGQAPPRFNSR
jgi:hypothetical protein